MQVIHFTQGATDPISKFDAQGGMRAVLSAGEPVRLESEEGAILLAVESPQLVATARGLSTPARIADQHWPGERPQHPR